MFIDEHAPASPHPAITAIGSQSWASSRLQAVAHAEDPFWSMQQIVPAPQLAAPLHLRAAVSPSCI
jgi:hypothetical protein